MSKRVRITAIVATLCVCLSLFVVGVLSATTATLNVSSTLKFEADGVYVMVDGKLKQGTAVDALDLTTSSTYTGYSYSRIGGSGTDQHAPDGSASSSTFLQADGTTPAGDWAIGEITFTSTNKVVIYEFTVNNYSEFDVTATITTNIAEELADEISNNQLTLDTYKDDIKDTTPAFNFTIPARTSVTTPGSTTYKIVVTLTNFMSSILTNEISMNFKFEEKLDVALSGSQYSGATHAVLAPTGSGSFTGGTTITDSSSTVNWDSLEANLTTTERAVKYRMEVTNNTEAGISGTGAFTIVGQTNPTPTTAGGVNTYTFADYTVTEYAQYIKNIQPNDTQVYELVIELNENASATTVSVSIAFTFTDSITYSIEWEGDTYNYVNMGSYPQRYVGNTMNAELEDWYTNQPVAEKYTAYKGCSGSTLNEPVVYNAYEYIDGNTYVRVDTTDVYSSNPSSARYMTGDEIENGVTAWYKVEPIQWRVLNSTEILAGTTNQAVLLSELALSANTTYYYDYTGAQNQTNNYAGYKSSTIREFLTNSFYNEALTSKEQAKVTTRALTDSELDGYQYSSSGNGAGVIDADTSVTDSVWLPTRADYINSSYGFSTSTGTTATRRCSPSDFAIANYAYTHVNSSYTTPARQNGGTAYYWTSSADSASGSVIDVTGGGYVGTSIVDRESLAARPALLFNL